MSDCYINVRIGLYHIQLKRNFRISMERNDFHLGYDIRDEHDDMWTKALVISVVRHLQDSPAVAQPVADERAAFQEWIKSKKLLASEPMWIAWQARAALCQPAEEGGKS